MAQTKQDSIESLIDSLATLQGRSGTLTNLAQQVKRRQQELITKQTSLINAVKEIYSVIDQSQGTTKNMLKAVEQAIKGKETQATMLDKLTQILKGAPSDSDISTAVQALDEALSEITKRSQTAITTSSPPTPPTPPTPPAPPASKLNPDAPEFIPSRQSGGYRRSHTKGEKIIAKSRSGTRRSKRSTRKTKTYKTRY